jgi:hypothetical protein
VDGRTKDLHPYGTTSTYGGLLHPLGSNFTPRGDIKNWPQACSFLMFNQSISTIKIPIMFVTKMTSFHWITNSWYPGGDSNPGSVDFFLWPPNFAAIFRASAATMATSRCSYQFEWDGDNGNRTLFVPSYDSDNCHSGLSFFGCSDLRRGRGWDHRFGKHHLHPGEPMLEPYIFDHSNAKILSILFKRDEENSCQIPTM